MAYLARILIYPVKSLDSLSVPAIRMLASGALEGDRQFAIVDDGGKYINGKKHPAVHKLRCALDVMTRVVHLHGETSQGNHGPAGSFHVDQDRARLEKWLGEFFGFAVHLQENPAAGFPDDTDSPGPTIISTATLHEVASWFPGVSVDSMRARMRANLEIGGVEAFWEDRLYRTADATLRFRIGQVEFEGVNPCQRCAVPPRDPLTGESYAGFAKIFATKREETLPPWAERSRFNHFYRLAVNTRVPVTQAGNTLHLGDEITLGGC